MKFEVDLQHMVVYIKNQRCTYLRPSLPQDTCVVALNAGVQSRYDKDVVHFKICLRLAQVLKDKTSADSPTGHLGCGLGTCLVCWT